MSKSRLRWYGPAAIAAVGALILTACGTQPADEPTSGGAGEVDTEAEVTITVGGMPTTENAESRAFFLERVEQFQDEHPNITIEPSEVIWDPMTFNAQLQGGTLPDVLSVAFTDVQGLISRGQVANLTDYVADDEVITGLNQSVLDVATGPDGDLYGIPTAAYSMSLAYDRTIFEQAGLDPDNPPTTWDEVREAAQAIEANTDAAGFGMMTTQNTGGWSLVSMTYAFGNLTQGEVDGTTQATFADTDGMADALQWIHDVRWEDDAWVPETIVAAEDARNLFAGGQLGMWISAADIYNDVVFNRGMDPDALGLAPLPQVEGSPGVLGGGGVFIISPDADPNQIAASIEWIKFNSLSKFTDEEVAVSEAESRAADGLPVGAPGLWVVGDELGDQYLEWIQPYVNVPREHFTQYLESTSTIPLLPEPTVEAQAMYAALDVTLQAVLTDENVDIDQLLQDTQDQFNASISAG